MLLNMKYFFVLGNNPALSVAEINAVLGLKKAELLAADFLLADIEGVIDSENLISRLGGTIKIGVIRSEVENKQNNLSDAAIKMSEAKQATSPSGKFNFGFSGYGDFGFNKKDIGIKIKNRFNEKKISSRYVVSNEKTLSSVVITQNKLIARGIEIVAIKNGNIILLGETLSVQPFKDLSRRDFGRPARDDLSGMLPPKLAMTMINLAGIDNHEAVIVDPFCGSGTILGEAALMGYKNLFGSDISKKAIDDTYTNFSWIKELYKIEGTRLKLAVKSALKLSQFIKSGSADAVITEPFLGPQRGMINFKETISNLEELYSGSISEFKEVLKRGGKVVMVWPSFYGQKPISPKFDGFKLIPLLPENLAKGQFVKQSERGTITYGRPGQKVFREIVLLEKI